MVEQKNCILLSIEQLGKGQGKKSLKCKPLIRAKKRTFGKSASLPYDGYLTQFLYKLKMFHIVAFSSG